jgi:nucleoid-associated protein YgaU
LGLIKHCQNKLREYKRVIGSFSPFSANQALTGRYENASFYSSAVRSASSLTLLLEQLRVRVKTLIKDSPNARYFVKANDTLQKIALKFYGSTDSWKQIYDFNNLTSTELISGTILEIPET